MTGNVVILGLILSADSFSAAVAMGGRKFSTRDLLKFALASGGAEALSSLAGYFAGSKLISLISEYDHWIAFALLASVAAHMAFEAVQGLRGLTDPADTGKFHGFGKVLLVSFATSMDAFGVGIGLGIQGHPVWPYLGSIAFWAFTSTVAGLYVGNHMSKALGPVFTLLAAAVLGYMSVQMLKI